MFLTTRHSEKYTHGQTAFSCYTASCTLLFTKLSNLQSCFFRKISVLSQAIDVSAKFKIKSTVM